MMKFNLLSVSILVASIFFQSCGDNDDNNAIMFPNALVTVKIAADDSPYLQLDDETTLFPENMKTAPFGKKEVRALTNITILDGNSSKYSKTVHVNWIDSIRTKDTAPDLKEENDAKYGKDPVEIVNDWVTIAEDGYLTLRFRTLWGDPGKVHMVNLIAGVNPENPYELEFRHNANGDVYGVRRDALVAFNLKDLPDTKGETVKLKLKWNSFSGPKSVEFNYCSRKGNGVKLQINNIEIVKALD